MALKFFAAAALITLGTLGSATAADMSAPAPAYGAPPPPLPVYNWTGCYVGGGGGYAFWQQDSFVVSPGGAPLTASQSNGGTGWFGQGQVGCDYQFQLRLPLFTLRFSPRSLSAPSAISRAAASMAARAFPGSLEASASLQPGQLVGGRAYWSRRAFLPTSTVASPKPVSTV